MANVITRKRLYGKDTNEDTKIRRMKSCVGEKLQAEKLHNILKHLKGKALELPVSILSKFIEQKGLEFSLILVKNLPALQEGLKIAQAQTATLFQAMGISNNVATKLITAANKTFGSLQVVIRSSK